MKAWVISVKDLHGKFLQWGPQNGFVRGPSHVLPPKHKGLAESLLQGKASLPSTHMMEFSCSHLFIKQILNKCLLCAKHSSRHWGYIQVPASKFLF